MVLPSTAKEVRIGVAVAYTAANVDGSETLKSSGKVTKHKHGSEVATIASAFAEIAMDNGFGLGIEQVSGTAELGKQSRTQTLAADAGNDAGTNTAKAEIDGLTSVYLIKTFQSGIFVKGGMTSATVNTKENLDTGSIYKNADVDGTLFGIGLHKATDSGFFYRVSGEFTDYDTINLTSTTAADATTTTLNKVKADIDTMAFKVSVGKAF
jgi:hypothetical protein